MTKVSLDDQIAAVEITVANYRGTISNMREQVSKKRMEKVWLEVAEDRYPKLVSVLSTLKWLKKNEDKIKKALGS